MRECYWLGEVLIVPSVHSVVDDTGPNACDGILRLGIVLEVIRDGESAIIVFDDFDSAFCSRSFGYRIVATFFIELIRPCAALCSKFIVARNEVIGFIFRVFDICSSVDAFQKLPILRCCL